MADELILEWSRDRVRVLSVASSGSRWNVRASGTLDSVDLADPLIPAVQAGESLKSWLRQIGAGSGRTSIVLHREMVVVRILQLPQAPDDELPDLVRFQAATRTSAPMDTLVLDFLPLQSSAGASGREVTTVTIERDRLSRLQAVCEAAGLEVQRVTISSLTAGRLVREIQAPDLGLHRPDLVFAQTGERLELSIFDQGTLVFSHGALRPEGADLKLLKSELTRSVVALSQVHPEVTLQRCYYLSGDNDAAVIEVLRERFAGGVQTVDVFKLLDESAAEYASLLGAVLPEEDDRLRLDLLHPRVRRVLPDRRRLYFGAAAAMLALVFLTGCWIFYSQKSVLEASISSLQQMVSDQEAQLLKGKPRGEAHDRIARWKEADASPLDLWNTLRACLPSTERVYFWELRLTPLPGENLARFVGHGQARDRNDIESLNQTLSDRGFRVRPTTPALGKRDPAYPWQFEMDVELPREKSTTPSPTPKAIPGKTGSA